MKRASLPLQTKYAITILTLVLAVVAVLAGTLLFQSRASQQEVTALSADRMERDLLRQMSQRGEAVTRFLASNLVKPIANGDDQAIFALLSTTRQQRDVLYVYLYDKEGRIVHDGRRQITLKGLKLDDKVSRMTVAAEELLIQIERDALDVSLLIKDAGQVLGGVRVGLTLKGIRDDIIGMRAALKEIGTDALQGSILTIGLTACIFLAVGVFFAITVARRLTNPIKALSESARRIGAGDYRDDVQFERADEIGELVNAFREMSQNLQRTVISRDYVDGVIASMMETLVVTSGQGIIKRVNKALCKLLGYSERELTGAPLEKILSLSALGGQQGGLGGLIERASRHPIDIHYTASDGRKIPVSFTAAHMSRGSGATMEVDVVCVAQDVTARKAAERAVKKMAYYDSLTNLPNRAFLAEHLKHVLAQAKRDRHSTAILYLDLDQFKRVNDTLGHNAGDALLSAVAKRLQHTIRSTDYLARNHLNDTRVTATTQGPETVARLGGDEFVVVLPKIYQPQDAARVAQKIIQATSEPFRIEGNEIVTTTSIGIIVYPDDGEDPETLLKNVDAAMYFAKEQGRNNYQFYTKSLNAAAFEKLVMETHLRHGLKNDQFMLYFQPQVKAETGEIVGAEALVRWQHPELGMVSPGQFIPIAEDTGLILPLGVWILRAACRHAEQWYSAGLRPIRVAVNLSSRQFLDKNLVSTVRSALDEFGLPPECLELEITESVIMEEAESTIDTLNELKDMGIMLSIDDFGTGYSSLSYLKRFPVDTLKVDQSFVRDIGGDPDDAAISQAIIAMAHALELSVIAEGVENETQLAFMREYHCEEIQGYYFSPPVPAEEYAKLLKQGTITPRDPDPDS